MVVCADLANQVRGKGLPVAALEGRGRRGVGWVPTNAMITCFNTIAPGPYGSLGDLRLVPELSTEVEVDFDDGRPPEHFVLGDLHTAAGEAWVCCPRSTLAKALRDLEEEAGLQIRAAFEHEFWCEPEDERPWSGFSHDGYRRGAALGETLFAALRVAGIEPDTFLPEYGRDQYEVTVAPAFGVRAADECVVVRELARATARRLGRHVSFSPVVNDDVGNGLHLHLSLADRGGTPCTFDADAPLGLRSDAAAFFEGVRVYLPEYLALCASSALSCERLVPHRWSAAWNNLAVGDREAALRVCPIDASAAVPASAQMNVEFRAADATGNPYLQLAAIVRAGLAGIRSGARPAATEGDLGLWADRELAERGVERLAGSLSEALDRLEASPAVGGWFPRELLHVYVAHKRGELAFTADRAADEVRALYAGVY